MKNIVKMLLSRARTLVPHHSLLMQFTARDFTSRYKGTHFGLLWSVLLPIFMVAMYTFVFGFIFKSRWGAGNESKVLFGTALFAGLIPFNFFCEVLTSSATLIHSNSNLVKRVVFPLEVLPVSRTLSSLGHALISLVLLLCLSAYQGLLSPNWLYIPLLFIPFIAFCLGLSFFMAALSVFVRDVSHVLGTFVSLCLFLSPIFYSLDAVPNSLKPIMQFNPLAIMAEQTRRCAVFGLPLEPFSLIVLWVFGIAMLTLGAAWFKRLKPSFADVM